MQDPLEYRAAVGDLVMDVVRYAADVERSPALHLARLLILIDAFTEDRSFGRIDGLTKLAKLDFLLRYPVMLERALQEKGVSTRSFEIERHEYHSVESQMVRYRFGPWDHRYRGFLNDLAARGLVEVSHSGRTIEIRLTETGHDIAQRLSVRDQFVQYKRRADLLKRHFNQRGTTLMRFIYQTFPEIVSLKSDSSISI